ncbi:hypothetical protein B0H12DRAFT_1243765 [Mycena haematopus]|nr:hypothetical protein B0H12DRAFT_1243765 [Mycena haematopus]
MSENSDIYYENLDEPSPAPSETADLFGWASDASAYQDSRDVTPTPQPARASSPASVVEISPEEFPPLAAPAPATVTKARAKANKGKGKAKTAPVVEPAPEPAPTEVRNDPFLAADIARATAASLGLTISMGHSTEDASSSRRPAAGPGSPAKRLRSNTAGEAAPPPFTLAPFATAASTAAGAVVAAPPPPVVGPPVTAASSSPITSPFLTPVAAAPGVAPSVAHVAAPPAVQVAAQAIAQTYAAAAAPQVVVAAVAPVVAAAAPAPDAPAPLWLTADGLPPRGSYTPTPVGGFPNIVYSPERLLQGVPTNLQEMYEEVAHPKFFLLVSGGNGAVMKTHGLIREAIGNFINIDPTAFTLGTPPTAADGTSPVIWLAAGIQDHLAQAIVDARILSTANITLFSLPYNMPVIGFVGVFEGFTLPNSNEGADLARDLLRSVISHSGEIAQFVQTHRDAFGSHVSAEQAWGIFLESIAVHGIVLVVNDTNTVAWRLYVSPPTANRDFWSQLRRLFGKLQIMTALHGTARLRRALHCHICPSIDHPTPLCPLPGLHQWLGPTPATIAALQNASRQAAAKAQEQIRANSFNAGGSNSRFGDGRNQGPANGKPRRDGKGKRGGDFKGKGKRRERDEFF